MKFERIWTSTFGVIAFQISGHTKWRMNILRRCLYIVVDTLLDVAPDIFTPVSNLEQSDN